MSTGKVTTTMQFGVFTINSQIEATADGENKRDPTLPAGSAGTLSTRTDADTGIATVAEGHGITDSDEVDVYWSGGMCYGMDVSATTSTTVSIDGGTGDDLPTQDTAIVVTKRVEIDLDFEGDDLAILAMGCDRRCHVELTEDDDTSHLAREIVAGGSWSWVADQGITNPIASDTIGKAQATCGEAAAGQFKLVALFDSTP